MSGHTVANLPSSSADSECVPIKLRWLKSCMHDSSEGAKRENLDKSSQISSFAASSVTHGCEQTKAADLFSNQFNDQQQWSSCCIDQKEAEGQNHLRKRSSKHGLDGCSSGQKKVKTLPYCHRQQQHQLQKCTAILTDQTDGKDIWKDTVFMLSEPGTPDMSVGARRDILDSSSEGTEAGYVLFDQVHTKQSINTRIQLDKMRNGELNDLRTQQRFCSRIDMSSISGLSQDQTTQNLKLTSHVTPRIFGETLRTPRIEETLQQSPVRIRDADVALAYETQDTEYESKNTSFLRVSGSTGIGQGEEPTNTTSSATSFGKKKFKRTIGSDSSKVTRSRARGFQVCEPKQPKPTSSSKSTYCLVSSSSSFCEMPTGHPEGLSGEKLETDQNLHPEVLKFGTVFSAPSGDSEPCVVNAELQPNVCRPADNRCPICTDEISGYHYGIFSCESCKGFFKRTIQNKRNEHLDCAGGGSCTITLQNRKHCAYCRYKKCLEAGMKLEAVRVDRQRGGRSMYEGSTEFRRRKLLQAQHGRTEKTSHTNTGKDHLNQVSSTFTQHSKRRLAVSEYGSTSGSSNNLEEILPSSSSMTVHPHLKDLENVEEMFFNLSVLPTMDFNWTNSEQELLKGAYHLLDHFLMSMPHWIAVMPLVKDLELSDRVQILRASWLHVVALTLCFCCHDDKGIVFFPDQSCSDLTELVQTITVLDIVRRVKQLAIDFHQLKTTREEYLYLKLLLLLNPDVKALSQPSHIMQYQEQVQENLFNLGIAQEGASGGTKTGELLLRLSELERLSHLIREHLLFKRISGQLGPGPNAYPSLENWLDQY